MIWLFFFLLLGLANADVIILSPKGASSIGDSGEIVDASTYDFQAYVKWTGSSGDTPPSSPFTCTYTIYDGGSSPHTLSTTGTLHCSIAGSTQTCIDYVSVEVSGLQPGVGWWNIDCGSELGSASTPPGILSSLCGTFPTFCILYDFEDPEVEVDSPENGKNYPGPDVPLEYSVSDDNEDIQCKVYLDGATTPLFTHHTSSDSATFTETLRNLEWGTHTLLINCSDRTRYYKPEYRHHYTEKYITFKRWVADTPQIHLLSPDEGFATNDPTSNPVIFRFWVSGAATDYVDCEIKLDRGGTPLSYLVNDVPNVTTTTPSGSEIITFRLPTSITDGKWEGWVECTDRGPGNTGKSDTRTFWIDTQPPYKIEMLPADGTGVSDLPLELRYRVFDAISDKLTCTLTLDGSLKETAEVNNGEWHSYTVNSITTGTHSWTIECEDVAGNSLSQSQTFKYEDILPPVITLLRPATGEIYPPGPVKFKFEVRDSSSYTCTIYLKSSVDTSFANIGTLTGTGSSILEYSQTLAEENYEWKVKCRDASGNEAESEVNYFAVHDVSSDASSVVGGAICAAQPFHSDLRDVTALLLVIGAAIAVSGIIFGNFFNSPKTVMGAKAEIKSLIVTGLLFAILLGLTGSMCGFIEERLLNGWANFSALIKTMEEPAYLSALIYGKATYISGLTPPQYQMNIPYVDITYKKNLQKLPFDYMQDIEGITDLLLRIAGSYAYYDRLVSYLIMFSMQVLLYLGLMLRMTPFTRRYGTTILALSVTLIFILPILYEGTANMLYHLTKDYLNVITGTLSYVHGVIDKYFITIYNGIKDLATVAKIFNLLNMLWALIHLIFLAFYRFATFFIPALPIALSLVFGVSQIIYQAFLAIGGFIWTALLTSVLSTMGGAVNEIPELYEEVAGIMEYLAFINLMSIFFYVVNLLVILGVTRALSLLGGGDYFLYGVEDHI